MRCRTPLGTDGRCPDCGSRVLDTEAEAAVAEKLRRLKEEVERERRGVPPSAQGARLWSRKPENAGRKGGKREEAAGRREAGDPPAGPVGGSGDETASRSRDPAASGSGHAAGAPSSGASDRPSGQGVREGPRDAPGAASREASDAPRRVWRGHSASAIRARELDVKVPGHGSAAVEDLLEHRRRGSGRIVGIAGLPRHGKTKLADRLRERAAERPGADLRYDKTERGEVNIYYLPGRREHHVLVDVAGEDFQALGDYEQDVPALMREFLWPVLQEIDGLVLLMALPIVWSAWNHPHRDARQEPSERDEIAMRDAARRMLDAHKVLLKYAVVARSLKRLRRSVPELELDGATAPTRNQVDDAFKSAPALDVPVAVGFSKADLYALGGQRSGLYTPDLPRGGGGTPPPPLHPLRTDPMILARLHFPDFFDFLLERVRHFHFDFVQALVDRSAEPDPTQADEGSATVEMDTLVGAEGLVEFVTRHPWRFPAPSTRTLIRLSRWLDRDRWEEDAVRRLHARYEEEGR